MLDGITDEETSLLLRFAGYGDRLAASSARSVLARALRPVSKRGLRALVAWLTPHMGALLALMVLALRERPADAKLPRLRCMVPQSFRTACAPVRGSPATDSTASARREHPPD